MRSLSLALGLWQIGLVWETDLMTWVDTQILESENPLPDLLEFSMQGVSILRNPPHDFVTRPHKFSFLEQFSLRAHSLDLGSDVAAMSFIRWVSSEIIEGNINQPEIALAHKLEHWYCDIKEANHALAILRAALPMDLPIAQMFLAEVPDLRFQQIIRLDVVYTFDGFQMTNTALFWAHYVKVIDSESIGYFGRNFHALWDALSAGGPGAPDFPCTFKFINPQEANQKLLDALLEMCRKISPVLLKIILEPPR